MIETFCCTLIALILRVLAGVYEVKFAFLGQLKVILLIAALLFGVITAVLLAVNMIVEIREKRIVRERKKNTRNWE